ncbi:fatty acid--CoA ligase [Streptomyces adustus]|uniref:fatty acid--CoA ligase n=1 Tax=Streptomyces adustus TaxID=1609272 RepID=UPI0037203AFB
MHSTMQSFPLLISSVVRHGTTVHADSRIRTLQADGSVRATTYAQLGARVAQLAHALKGLGITGDQRVATFLWNNQEHVEAYCAVPSMGAVLHTLNIRLTPEQIAYIANHAEDQVLIAAPSLASVLAPVLPHLTTVHTVIAVGEGDLAALRASGKTVIRYEDFLAGHPTTYDWPRLDENAAAAMCYTSGTTGNPKGVVYSHRSTYLHSMAACSTGGFEVGLDDAVLAIVPQFHANAWGFIYAALMSGADLVMPDRFLQTEALVDLIELERPTITGAVPTILSDMLSYLDTHPGHDISSLRLAVSGGSAVPRQLMEAMEQRYGVRVMQAWGMTETSPIAAVARPRAGTEADRSRRQRASQGRVLAGVEARIVDDAGNPVPNDGVSVGELQVRGPWITAGYYLDEDADNFQDGWLRTGDVGRIDGDHFITLTDRAKDVIKSGGEWISSVELELTIATHPDVVEAAVVGVADDRWQERPLAAVVLRDGATTGPAELRAFLKDKVANWWIPERWTFIEQVPRTSVGKYDKKALRTRHLNGELEICTA